MVSLQHGILAEWFKAPSWKGGIVQAIVGSNPTYSAKNNINRKHITLSDFLF